MAVVYREPYATLAEFPLAGQADDFPSEPQEVLSLAEKPEIAVKWLGILTAIRDMRAKNPAFALQMCAA